MSQSTDDLTRSELRAIRRHYRRRVYIAFLIPALIAVALGWLLFQDQDAQSGEPSQATPRPPSVARSPTRSSPRTVWPPSRRPAPCWIGPPRRSRTGGCAKP